MFQHSPNGKMHGLWPLWNVTPMEKTLWNGIYLMEYMLMVYSSKGKDMVLWEIVFRSGNICMIKDKKNTAQKVPVVFEEFEVVYIFFASFFLFTAIVNW